MHTRSLMIALGALAFAAACSDSDNDNGITGNDDIATVRFVNATNANIDVANGGLVSAGNGSLGFGTNSACMSVNANSPNIVFNAAGTTNAMAGFTANFTEGGNFTVVAFPDASGNTQFVTLNNGGFTAGSGNAGLRVFNGASTAGNLDIFAGAPGAALGAASASSLGFGTGSAFFNVPAGSGQMITFTNAGTTTVLGTSATSTFNAGTNSLLVIAPPAVGTTAFQTFVVPGC